MYIIPSYVSYYEDEGSIFVTSQLYNNTIKLSDPDVQKEFRNIIHCGGSTRIATPLETFLHSQSLLANAEEIDAAIAEVRQVMASSLLVTLMPTEGCNFRCPYCYETHIPNCWNWNIQEQIQRYLLTEAPKYKLVSLGWFGGEPTLCKDIILETSEKIQTLQKQCSFHYVASMTTNGYLLDMDSFLQYYNAGITSYQITLDGWEHDKTRPHRSGKGTLKTILDNLTSISSLPQNSYHFQITLRHNILPGDNDYTWYDHLYSLFGKDKRFSVVVRPVSNWGGEGVKSMELLTGNALKEHLQNHVHYLKKIGMPCENEKKGFLSQVCYASYPHSMVFRADGKIEKCTVCLDHPKNQVGIVDPEQGVLLDENANRIWTESTLTPQCYHCADLLSCLNMYCKAPAIIHGNKTHSCRDNIVECF